MNSPVEVMGLESEADAVWVRWPGGKQTTTPIRAGETMIRIQGPSGR